MPHSSPTTYSIPLTQPLSQLFRDVHLPIIKVRVQSTHNLSTKQGTHEGAVSVVTAEDGG